jgi:hypothetical protein
MLGCTAAHVLFAVIFPESVFITRLSPVGFSELPHCTRCERYYKLIR